MKEYTVKGIKVSVSDKAITSFRFIRLMTKAADEKIEPLQRFSYLMDALEFLFAGDFDDIVSELEAQKDGEYLQMEDVSSFFEELMNKVADGKN